MLYIALLGNFMKLVTCIQGDSISCDCLLNDSCRIFCTTYNYSVITFSWWFVLFSGAQEEIDYSAKLKFSDDEGEDDGEEERTEHKTGTR